MIRMILAAIAAVLFFVLTLPILLVFHIFYKRYPQKIDHYSLAIVKWALNAALCIAGTKVIAIGEENIPKDTAVMYAANHASIFDVLITYPRVPRLTGYISKMSVKKVPVLNLWMNRVHCLFLDRDDVKQGLTVILEAIKKVKSGISIFIFPEGTRNRQPETLLPFKEGSFKIASKSGCPIIPVSIVNSQEIFEAHFPCLKKTTVVVEYGAPIYVKDLNEETQKHVGAYVQHIISETNQKNRAAHF